MNRLEVSGLQKTFKGRRVVDNFGLTLEGGEVVGLLGPNGAGKTTSFYMIVGLIAADAGSILINGQEVRSLPIDRRAKMGLGYLPQEPSIFRHLSVMDNVRAVLEIGGCPKRDLTSRAMSLLEELNVAHLRDSMAQSLSGGERRRVEIARVLATEPRFILLDEPFAGVDPIAVIDIQHIIAYLRDRGIGVLITDHNVRETLRVCSRGYIISKGSVLMSGTPDELVGDERVRSAYLGSHYE